MNHCEPTSAPRGAGQTFPCLALLLLPLLSGVHASAWPLPSLQAGLTQQKPYLVALGAAPLRFQESAPEAALAIRPPKPGAPRLPSPDTLSGNPEAMAHSSPELPANSTSSLIAHDSVAKTPIETEVSPSLPNKTPLPILPDETHAQARPEDFLPFFQIPVTQPGEVNVIVPVPRAPAVPSSLPLSSATYTQTPR
jgi:hypothetical protein